MSLSPKNLEPKSYQIPAIEAHLRAHAQHKFSLDASEMGLGKTIIALLTIKKLDLPFGVVCPANAVPQWEEECRKCGMEPDFVASYEKLKNGSHFALARDTIVRGPKKIHKFRWKATNPCFLVFDEAHNCSGDNSQNSKMLKAAFEHPYIKIIGLSGTAANDPRQMKVLGYCLGLHNFQDYYWWCMRNGCTKGYFGGLDFNAKPGNKAEKSLKLIHELVFPGHGYRLRKLEIAKDLPENDIQPVIVDISSSYKSKLIEQGLQEIYEKEKEDIKKATENGEAPCVLTTNTRERQKQELYKIPWLIEQAKEVEGEGGMPIIFCQFSCTLDLLQGDLNYRELRGGQTPLERQQVIESIENNTAPGIIVQIDAGAASLNLQDQLGSRARTTFVCPTYNAKTFLQALGRAHRIGAKSPVVQKLVFNNTPIEKRIYEAVKAKVQNLELLNDGELSGMIFKNNS